MKNQTIIEDTLNDLQVNRDGKVFDKVSRISGSTLVHKLQIELDVNTDIYEISANKSYALVLARSVTADGEEDFDLFQHTGNQMDTNSNLIDKYEYVMHGKIFEENLSDDGQKLTVYISFGGLLMSIVGQPQILKELELDSRIYLLMRKVA